MKVDDVKKLHQKRYREEFARFLVEGEHLVLELQKAAKTEPQLRDCELFVTHEYEHWKSPFRTHLISTSLMAGVAETKTPQGIVAVVPLLLPPPLRDGERAVFLSEIQDPGNLGTVLRTLAWFGRFRCVLSPGSVDPWNPKVVRASAGAIFHVPIETGVPLAALSARFPRIACLDLRGDPIANGGFGEHDCYVFGNEARGLPHDALAAIGARPYAIRGAGTLESLNLASAVNMCLYELNREQDGPS